MNKILKTLVILSLFSNKSHSSEPKDWQLGLQESVTSIMDDVVFMHNYILMPIITAISVFVLFLLFYVCIKFRESKNPNPSKTTHNTFIEIVWTLIPCLILKKIFLNTYPAH